MAVQPPPGATVSHGFAPHYIVLSYLVSVVGCWTTLELLSWQTATRGACNWSLLICSAVTMNAVGIWAMHFIGNAALIMGNGSPQEKITYYVPWTVASLFLPVFVIGIAFWLLQRASEVRPVTMLVAGLVCGAAICGMHFSGQMGIANYANHFDWMYVLGSAILACTAASFALGIFFSLKTRWNSSWWKRGITAAMLAAAVSSMHWVAIAGTNYTSRAVSPTAKLAMPLAGWICGVLAVACCFVLLLFVIFWDRLRRINVQRSKEISLALACLNPVGKIMLNSSGYIPCKRVISHFEEQTADDIFGIDHDMFIWLFRLSRNWKSIAYLMPQIRRRLHEEAIQEKQDGLHRVELKENIPNLRRLKELFAVAAFDLKSHFHADLDNFGVLYDGIIETCTISQGAKNMKPKALVTSLLDKPSQERCSSDLESGKGSLIVVGRGQMLFLVRHVDARSQSLLEAQGYTFKSLTQGVKESVAKSLQISMNELKPVLNDIREYPEIPHMLEPGIYMASFAVRPSFSSSKWEIMVQKRARNLLPCAKVDIERLESWQTEIIEAAAGKDPETLRTEWSVRYSQSVSPMGSERRFLKLLFKAMNELGERFFSPVPRPSNGRKIFVAQVIAFHGFADIHHCHPKDAPDEFLPSNLVIAYQQIYPNSLHHVEFANSIRSDFGDLDLNPDVASRTSIAGFMEEFLPGVVREKVLMPARAGRARLLRSISSEGRRSSPKVSLDSEREEPQDSPGPVRNASRKQYLDVSVSHHVEVKYEPASSENNTEDIQTPGRPNRSSVQSEVSAGLLQPSMVEQLLEMTLNSRRRYQLSIH